MHQLAILQVPNDNVRCEPHVRDLARGQVPAAL